MKALLFVACSALLAPYQCASGESAERPVEDTAPKALWNLAERFREQGDIRACDTVYSQLTEQYPSSRYAKQARETNCSGGSTGYREKQAELEAQREAEREAKKESSGSESDIEAGGTGDSSEASDSKKPSSKSESGSKDESGANDF